HHVPPAEPGVRGRDHPVDHLGLQGLRAGVPDAGRRRLEPRGAEPRRVVVRRVVRAEPVRLRLGDRRAAHPHAAGHHRRLRATAAQGGPAVTRPSIGRRLLKGVLVFLLLVFTLFPTYWMLVSAFDENPTGGAQLVPRNFTWDHFVYVLTDGGFATYLRNSVVVALVVVIAAGLLGLLASIAVARFRFR